MGRLDRTIVDGDSYLLHALRGTGTPRPVVDPSLAGGLKEWLEDALSDVARGIDDQSPTLRIHQRHVCAAFATGSAEEFQGGLADEQRGLRPGDHDDGLLLEVLVRCIFRQWITVRQVGNPMNDAVSALAALGGHARIAQSLKTMGSECRRRLVTELELHAERIVDQWPELCPSWYPRTRERFMVPVCGGRILLAGSVDLAVGFPARDRASVCLVEVTAGHAGPHRRSVRHFYALLETLRSGAPPSRVATFDSATGRIEAEQVDEHMLVGAVLTAVDAAKLHAGARARPAERAGLSRRSHELRCRAVADRSAAS
jgi:hypothetical protein